MSIRAKMAIATAMTSLGVFAGFSNAEFVQNGQIYVVRLGDASSNFSGAGAVPVFVDVYNTSGGQIGSHAITGLTLSKNTGDDSGHINFSTDNNYLTLGGYAQAPNTTDNPVTSSVARVIGRIDSSFNIDTSTSLTGLFTGVPITSVVTDNGSRFWASGKPSGSTGGLQYINDIGSSAANSSVTFPAQPTITEFRNMRIMDGQLYLGTPSSSSLPGRGVYRVDVLNGGNPKALPDQTPGDSVSVAPIIVSKPVNAVPDENGNTDYPNDGTGKFYPKTDFKFFDLDNNGVYDTAFSTGGKKDIEKWVYGGTGSDNASLNSVWYRTASIDITTITGGTDDINALDGYVDGSTINLFIANDKGIIKMVDIGGMGSGPNDGKFIDGSGVADQYTLFSTYHNPMAGLDDQYLYFSGSYLIMADPSSSGHYQFRGLAVTAIPEPAMSSLVAVVGVALLRRKRSR